MGYAYLFILHFLFIYLFCLFIGSNGNACSRFQPLSLLNTRKSGKNINFLVSTGVFLGFSLYPIVKILSLVKLGRLTYGIHVLRVVMK